MTTEAIDHLAAGELVRAHIDTDGGTYINNKQVTAQELEQFVTQYAVPVASIIKPGEQTAWLIPTKYNDQRAAAVTSWADLYLQTANAAEGDALASMITAAEIGPFSAEATSIQKRIGKSTRWSRQSWALFGLIIAVKLDETTHDPNGELFDPFEGL